MTQPPNYARQGRVSPIGSGPTELEHARWNWLQYEGFPLLARAFDDIVGRLDRIEQKIDALSAVEEPPRRRRRRKVADEDEDLEQ
jgi:hypothetical protein